MERRAEELDAPTVVAEALKSGEVVGSSLDCGSVAAAGVDSLAGVLIVVQGEIGRSVVGCTIVIVAS